MKKCCAIGLIMVMLTLCVPVKADAAITLSATKQLTVVIGEEAQIDFSGGLVDTISYKSTKPGIAAVDETGIITGKKIGSCQIKITAVDGEETSVLKTKITVVKKKGFNAAKVYKKLIAMKSKYPEGRPWTNDDSYLWHAFPYVNYHAFGCAAFASIMSDAAFGKKTVAKQIDNPSPAKVRVGDVLRMESDTHSVIVLKVESDGFIIAEGNYNSSIHWGRKVNKQEHIDYLYTRYEGK